MVRVLRLSMLKASATQVPGNPEEPGPNDYQVPRSIIANSLLVPDQFSEPLITPVSPSLPRISEPLAVHNKGYMTITEEEVAEDENIIPITGSELDNSPPQGYLKMSATAHK